MSQQYWDIIRLGFWPSYYGWDVKGYSQYVPMVFGPIKTVLLLWLGHIGIFSESPNGIRTNKDWNAGLLKMVGRLRNILSMSQWYKDQLRLGLQPSYNGWDILGYS